MGYMMSDIENGANTTETETGAYAPVVFRMPAVLGSRQGGGEPARRI